MKIDSAIDVDHPLKVIFLNFLLYFLDIEFFILLLLYIFISFVHYLFTFLFRFTL